MKTNKSSIFSLLALSIFIMGSCSNFLDLEPKSEATEEFFWKTEEDVNQSVSALYALTRQAFNQADGTAFYAYGDLPSDEFSGASDISFQNVIALSYDFQVPATETWHPMYQLRRYDMFYRIVDQANRTIEKLNQIDRSIFADEKVYNHYLGEAYFMRAFTYFFMARVWGSVPLIIQTVPIVQAVEQGRSTQQEVMSQVFADILKAEGLLSSEAIRTGDLSVRADRGALFALKAHAYAWTGNYSETINASDQVLSTTRYGYEPRDSTSYRRIFAGGNLSKEPIFAISQTGNNEGSNSGIGRRLLVSPYTANTGDPNFHILLSKALALYDEAGDKRLMATFNLTLHPNFAINTKYANVTRITDGTNNISLFKNNIVVFRYSDIVLLKAEALAAVGGRDEEAIALLNAVRSQAGLGAWNRSGDLFEVILNERARELFLEGHRMYDMIRFARETGKFTWGARSNGRPRLSQEQFLLGKYYWPLDPTLLALNPLLTQTSYWGTGGMND